LSKIRQIAASCTKMDSLASHTTHSKAFQNVQVEWPQVQPTLQDKLCYERILLGNATICGGRP
jgi:hypothetical protein